MNTNKILYEDWVKNQKEEDKIFIFDNGIMMVAFERLLGYELENNKMFKMTKRQMVYLK